MAARGDRGRRHGAVVHSPAEPAGRQPKDASRLAGACQLLGEGRQAADPLLREPKVSARGRLIGLQPAFAARPDHGVLADRKQPRCGTGADERCHQPQVRRRRSGESFDCSETESVVTSGRGFSRHQRAPRNGAENSRLAYAKTIGCLPRTDQIVQDVCRTNAAL